MRITNTSDISLSLAVWLINDNYDHAAGKEHDQYISVTTLMKPTKQIILAQRVPYEQRAEDVQDWIARALGNVIHDGIENAWKHNYERSLKLLGYPQSVINRIRINPTDEELREENKDIIPIFLEQREFRTFKGWTIGGKFDLVAEGHVEDNKSTSVWGWVHGTRDDEHILQGSLYRWIDAARDPEVRRITEDWMRVNYIFTDWQKAAARGNPAYPQKRVEHKDYPLLPLGDVDFWVNQKLKQINEAWHKPEDQLNPCSDEELWRSEPKFKYFANPDKTDGRSTKNFESLAEANNHLAAAGKGVIITQPGEVKRCPYCPAFAICEQRKDYFPDD